MLGDPATVRNVTASVYAVSGTGRHGPTILQTAPACASIWPVTCGNDIF